MPLMRGIHKYKVAKVQTIEILVSRALSLKTVLQATQGSPKNPKFLQTLKTWPKPDRFHFHVFYLDWGKISSP